MIHEFEQTRDEVVAVASGANVTEVIKEVLTRAKLPIEFDQLVHAGWYLVALPEMAFKLVIVTRDADRARQIASPHLQGAVVLGELPAQKVDTDAIELLDGHTGHHCTHVGTELTSWNNPDAKQQCTEHEHPTRDVDPPGTR